MSTAVDLDVGLLLDTVDHLAAKAERRLFSEESPDGDLTAIADLLLDAASIGLLADVDADAGRWAVWGTHADADGAGLSLAMLRRLGRVCAGFATAVHAQGLGLTLLGSRDRPAWLETGARIGAAFCPPFGIALDPRTEGDGLCLAGNRLDGAARFVLVAGDPDTVLLVAQADGLPALIALPPGTGGLRVEPSGRRVGLRATSMVDVIAQDVVVPVEAVYARGSEALRLLNTTLACDWLGQAAIALGCAERAVAIARDYTASRVQGGVAISEHAAIRLLLGRAEHDVAVLTAVLDRHTRAPLTEIDTNTLLTWAIDARLVASEHATRAVTDALQTLGGYGYMDEYGLSKRLRDVTALRVLHGGPDQLLLARRGLEAVS